MEKGMRDTVPSPCVSSCVEAEEVAAARSRVQRALRVPKGSCGCAMSFSSAEYTLAYEHRRPRRASVLLAISRQLLYH